MVSHLKSVMHVQKISHKEIQLIIRSYSQYNNVILLYI